MAPALWGFLLVSQLKTIRTTPCRMLKKAVRKAATSEDQRRTLIGHIENLNDARRLLADLFNILLGGNR